MTYAGIPVDLVSGEVSVEKSLFYLSEAEFEHLPLVEAINDLIQSGQRFMMGDGFGVIRSPVQDHFAEVTLVKAGREYLRSLVEQGWLFQGKCTYRSVKGPLTVWTLFSGPSLITLNLEPTAGWTVSCFGKGLDDSEDRALAVARSGEGVGRGFEAYLMVFVREQ